MNGLVSIGMGFVLLLLLYPLLSRIALFRDILLCCMCTCW